MAHSRFAPKNLHPVALWFTLRNNQKEIVQGEIFPPSGYKIALEISWQTKQLRTPTCCLELLYQALPPAPTLPQSTHSIDLSFA
jgi:hypothetical protein